VADSTALIGSGVFASTAFIIILHFVEWFRIGTLPRVGDGNISPSDDASKSVILNGALGIEMVYYFLLLIVFAVFFSGNLIFLTLVALLGVIHLTALQVLLSKKVVDLSRMLTTRRVTGVLLFDTLELLILIVLAVQFYPFFQAIF
jgi:hypothetical protein